MVAPARNGDLRRTIHAVLFRGDRYFVADCLEVPVITQGLTVEEALSNLHEAVALHVEDEDLEEVGLVRNPTISVTLELASVG
jgi:predicted RNase H-like HicB family nuclease